MAVIQVDGLRKAYGTLTAVDDVSFEVGGGEIFGMVGPNGAGKTTTIECIQGLRDPDAGKVAVLGLDPASDANSLRERIGTQLQQAELPDRIKVWEAMDLYASFYQTTSHWEELLERFDLTEKRNTPFTKLSGAKKQRLFIASALINAPELIFLDELTTGLDPQARRSMWALVREVRDQGKTVFLTTHFMDEAEQLCNRVAVIDHGKIIALDTPENLIRDIESEDRVMFTVEPDADCGFLADLDSVVDLKRENNEITITGHGELLVSDIVQALANHDVHWRKLKTEQPTLEDVFIELTGHEIRE